VSTEQIYKDLGNLLDEVDGLALDPAERQRLHRMISDIERHLDTPEEEAHSEIAETLEELVTRMEADHPTFTGILRRVLNALGSMGV